jgi:hypothetical protein
MAIAKIFFLKDADHLERYLTEKVGPDVPQTEHLTFLKGMSADYRGVQNDLALDAGNRNPDGSNQAIHIVQSWSPKESQQLGKDKVHDLGVRLAERFAPGHQFVVQTHAEEAHFHNHIVINPVNFETGKRIQNKTKHLHTVRAINDDLAHEHGLSVLPTPEYRANPHLSEKVRRIERMRGASYIVDMAAKADFARSHATNYDEYVAILGAFDIKVRIEPENITYFYGDRPHGKRGRNLSPRLDKPGLEKKFTANWERVQGSDTAKRDLAALIQEYRRPPDALTRPEAQANPARPLVSHRAEDVTAARREELERSVIPVEELARAKTESILRYCEREKIALATTADGRRVLDGRDYVEVSDHLWVNHRNKTRGTIIDFVASHRNVGYLHAVSHINNNPRLLLLERHLGEAKRHYQSFYVPRPDAAPRADALVHLARLIGRPSRDPVHAELLRRQLAHVTTKGSILLVPDREETGYVEYIPNDRGEFSARWKGTFPRPFQQRAGKSGTVRVYTDPAAFLRGEREPFGSRSGGDAVLALFEPDLAAAHRFIASQRKVRRVQVMRDPGGPDIGAIERFHRELKDSLDPFSIETDLAWSLGDELGLEPAREAALAPSLGRERELWSGISPS